MNITKPVRLIELFGGIGSQAMAFKELGVPFEHYRLIEFDKYPVASYNAIHGTSFTPTDIREVGGGDLGIVEPEQYTYFMTYSFPCQDLSVAGKGAGMAKGSGTRSGLLWEVERLLNEVDILPQILLMENVPQVHGKKNINDFQKWLDFLESKGYRSFWKDLNAKDFGIPQNRVRCFCVSILTGESYGFPDPIPLTATMEDFLQTKVEEKYYLKGEKVKKLVDNLMFTGKLSFRQTDRQTDRQSTCLLRSRELSAPQTASRHDTTQESQISKQTEAALLKSQGSELQKFTHIAATLMARDYKGFGNQEGNGVIEWTREKK